MKRIAAIALITGTLFSGAAGADFDIGISGSEKGISGLSLSIGDYYRVPHSEIIVIERAIPREEMSVVYLLSRRAHRDARFIADLRLRGLSWWDITIRLGLDPHTLYVVDTHRHSGPPYGKAYGYYKEGKKHRLRDDEIVELSNVRFLSKYHRVSTDDVIDQRRKGERYMNIDEHYRSKKGPSKYQEKRYEDRGSKGYDDRGAKGGKPSQERGTKGHGNSKGSER